MEEMKEILMNVQQGMSNMQTQFNGMQTQFNGMQNQINGMQTQFNGMQTQFNDMQNQMDNMQNQIQTEMQQMKENIMKEIRAGNQRLAVFQEDITPKINILFDADETRKELLEIHDSEICDIKKEQFEHTLKINRLEQKVIGA